MNKFTSFAIIALLLPLHLGGIAKSGTINPVPLGSAQKPTTNLNVTFQGVEGGGFSVSVINQIKDVQKQIDDKKAAEAQAAEDARLAQEAANAREIAPEPVKTVYPSSCSDAKSCIYDRESGNNPAATNPAGCFGLGQDCNGVLRAQCGVDYACQDAFFTNYAVSRYGSWDNAWAYWQQMGWW